MAGGNTLADIIADLIGDIVTDVRQSVVEEPWFGRVVTDSPDFANQMSSEPTLDHSIDLD